MSEIRSLFAADLVAAGAVLDVAYGRTGMTENLKVAHALQPESWFCACSERGIEGLVGAVDYGPFASIGMMAVHPAAQRQGLGSRLMERLVGHLDGRGCPVHVLDASAAGQPLYPRFGFAPEGRTLRMERRRAGIPHALLDDSCSVTVSELAVADLPAAVAFDTPIFGADRSAVIHSFQARRSAGAFIACGAAGRTAGYLIASAAGIGPWSAASPAAAEVLLRAALELPFRDGPRLTVPDNNTAGLKLLAHYGFEVTETLLHMRRGGARDPRRPDQIYGQASLALG